MKLLFATDRMHPPHDFSGSVQSTHSLVSRLCAQNVTCEVMASLPYTSFRHYLATAAYKASRKTILLSWSDQHNGYPTHRGAAWRFVERVRRHLSTSRPDALVLDSFRQLGALAAAGLRPDMPILIVVCDSKFTQMRKPAQPLPIMEQVHLLANSPFTARALFDHFGVESTVVPPLVEFDWYRAYDRDPRYVTFISPRPEKGLDIALEVARQNPAVDFLFVEGWPMDRPAWTDLKNQTSSLPNVRLERSHSDMREVYNRTRLLIVPTRVPETFGRVVVEAQVNGIPVLARDVGGLRETVGDGGVLLPPDADGNAWAQALASLIDDDRRFRQLSVMALANAARDDFQPDKIVEQFLSTVERAIRGYASPAVAEFNKPAFAST